jgi:hypothetical protein
MHKKTPAENANPQPASELPSQVDRSPKITTQAAPSGTRQAKAMLTKVDWIPEAP